MTQNTETILDRIVADKREELAAAKAAHAATRDAAPRRAERASPRGFAQALRGPRIALIAEVKKASPSRGVLRADFDPVWIAQRYARAAPRRSPC